MKLIGNPQTKILVIGGTGVLGFHICRFFLKKNWAISSISLNPPKKFRKLKKVKYFYADISKINSIKILKDVQFDFIVNCGSYVNNKSKLNNLKNHYIGCKNLYKILSKKKILKFIQIGSSLEYGSVKSPQKETLKEKAKDKYGKPKLEATNFLKSKKKFPFLILRLYQVYGPYQDKNRIIPFVINSCLKGKSFPCSEGSQYRDFLYIDDFLNALNKCLKMDIKNNEIINIGYGKPTKIKKIISMIHKNIKKGKPEYGKIKLRGDEQLTVFPSIAKAQRMLKWSPKTSIKKGIIKTVKHFKLN